MLAAEVRGPRRVEGVVGNGVITIMGSGYPLDPLLKGVVTEDLHLLLVELGDIQFIRVAETAARKAALATIGQAQHNCRREGLLDVTTPRVVDRTDSAKAQKVRFELFLAAQRDRPPLGHLRILGGHTLGTYRPGARLLFGFLDEVDALLGPPLHDTALIAFAGLLFDHIPRDVVPQCATQLDPLKKRRLLGQFLVDLRFFRDCARGKQAHKSRHQDQASSR